MVIRIGKHPKTNPQKTQRELKREREERGREEGEMLEYIAGNLQKNADIYSVCAIFT